jgi:peptidylprolyl isomerase
LQRRTFLSALALSPVLASSVFAAGPAANDPENTLILQLKDGRVVIRLRPDLAPKHVERLKTLARKGFYDGLKFHRVIDGFMAQTGDPRGDGTGGSTLPNLPAEFNPMPFERGVLGMARSSNPNSANSQFFIMFASAPSLNGQYTAFGEVVSGMEFVDRIKRGATAMNGSVADPDVIVKLQVAADAK